MKFPFKILRSYSGGLMLKNKKSRNKKGYGKIKSTEEWLVKEHKKQWKTNGKRKYRRKS